MDKNKDAAPEQEPFCYVSVNAQGDVTSTVKRKDKWRKIPLYTAPPSREWQSLSYDDVVKAYLSANGSRRWELIGIHAVAAFSEALDALLRAKNSGEQA